MGTGCAGSPAAGVGSADEVGVLGSGELGLHEVADRLKRRRADRETIAGRLDNELTPPELGELLGAAGYERLAREHARNLAVECVPFRAFLDGCSGGSFGVELFLCLFALEAKGVLDLAFGSHELDLLGPG